MNQIFELIAEQDGETTRLLSPGVGEFTCAVSSGSLLGPGQDAGVLIVTGRPRYLRVPAGVSGRIQNERPEKVHEPVGYRTVLYELAPVSAGGEEAEEEAAGAEAGGLELKASQTGRFYHRPSPDEPPFVEVGTIVEEGDAVGLVEVMKTFAHVVYRAEGGLPVRGKVVKVLVGDGEEMRQGAGLIEVEGV